MDMRLGRNYAKQKRIQLEMPFFRNGMEPKPQRFFGGFVNHYLMDEHSNSIKSDNV